MTTKQRLIELLERWDHNQIYPFLLINNTDDLADLIISKLPEWGWSYSDPDHPIHQEPERLACDHPPENWEYYHDNSILCNKCNCVIEQFGRRLEKPSKLSMKLHEGDPF